MKILVILAGINGAMAIGAGAYGWHSLGDTPDIRDVFMMGSQYQMWHAIALLGTGLLASLHADGAGSRLALIAGGLFQTGIVLFCGTLYAFGTLNIVPVEGAAPVGGWMLMGGWLALSVFGARYMKRRA